MEATKQIQHPEALFEHIIRFTNKKQSYNEGNRNNYIHLLAHNCNRRGLSQEQTIYYGCSRFDLSSQEIEQTIKSAYINKSENATDERGEKKASPPNIDRIEDFLSEKYEFRFNIVLNKLEYKEHVSNFFQHITDYRENSFLRELQKARIKCNITNLRTILQSDFCKVYNPFNSYFTSLDKWDEKTDHITALARTVACTHQELWEYCFHKWLVAMVGTAVDETTFNHCVIVFSGKQGIGKTTWILNLVPPELKDYVFSGTINPNNKDTLIHLSECFLINLDELENLNRSEIGSLKEIITKQHIRMRVAYGHNNENKIRRASFAGSVNNAQFLNDTTGSRRFLCFEVLEIDYTHLIEMDKVFTQAFHLYNNGYKFWFDKEEIKTITNNNEQYQMKTAEEELLLTWCEKPKDNNSIQYLTTSEIATKISNMVKLNVTNSTILLLGKALNKHGYERTKRGSRYVYAIHILDFNEVERRSIERESTDTTPKSENEQDLPF